MSEEKKEIDFNDLKPLDIKKSKGKFKTFTNASTIPESKDFQPYLGKSLTVNVDKILSVYPSEDGVGSMIHAEDGQMTWKVLEEIDVVIARINE